MKGKKAIATLLIAVFIISTLAVLTPIVKGVEPRILEVSPRTLPDIVLDGFVDEADWGDPVYTGPQNTLVDYSLYITSDDENLYIAAEVTEVHEGASYRNLGLGNALNVHIDVNNNDDVDADDLSLYPHQNWYLVGGEGLWLEEGVFSTDFPNAVFASDGDEYGYGAVGLGSVEFKLPLSYLGITPGDTIGLCLQAFGYNKYPVEAHPSYPSTFTDSELPIFSSIQAAIEAAGTGDTVLVHPGTYDESLTIGKSLTLQAASSPVLLGTIDIQDDADDTTIDGFTIQPTSGDAVHIRTAGNVAVTGCTIVGQGPTGGVDGIIYTHSPPASAGSVIGNTITDCELGIYLDHVDLYDFTVTGNTLEGCRKAIGLGTLSGAVIDDNTITGSTQMGIELCHGAAIEQNTLLNNNIGIYLLGAVDGTNIGSEEDGEDANTITGSTEYDIYAFGATGPVDIWEDNVYDTILIEDSNMIYFHVPSGDPAEATVTGAGSVDAPDADTTVDYTGANECTITVEDLAEDEVEEATFSAVGEYVDVKVDDPLTVTSLTITVSYDDTDLSPEEEVTLIMYWYDETNWRPCSNTGVETEPNYIWAIITDETSPSLSQMKGTPFGLGEGLTLDSDFYKKVDEITVEASNADMNQDPIRLDTITVDAKSTIDTTGITVVLTETGANTGIFTGSFPITDVIPPPVGYLAVDEGNLVTVEHSGTFAYATIDETAPLFDEEDPIVGLDFYNNEDTITLTIGLDATDYDVTVDFSAIDSEYTAGDEVVTGGPVYTMTYDINEDNTMVDGLYTITVTAEDAAGNTATSDFNTTLDNTMPSVTEAKADPVVIQPEDPTLVTFTVSVSDELSGVDTVTIDLSEIDGAVDQEMTEILEDVEPFAGTGVYTVYEASYTVALGGDYDLPITATDDVGNKNDLEVITLRVIADVDAPIFVSADVTYPTEKITAREGDEITVTVIVTDELSGVDTVSIDVTEIGIAEPKLMTLDVDTWTATLTVGTLIPAETYYLNVTATDYADNTASTLAEVLIQELATMEMYTLSTDYDSGDTVDFYVKASFAFNLTIEITDPTSFPYTTIECLEDEHWIRVGDYSIVPYKASFDLPSTAVSGTWSWTAIDTDFAGEVATGTFAVGVTYTGTLSITTTPFGGEVFVDEESWGMAPVEQVVEVGTYDVTFGAVDGYTTPASQEAVVTADTTTDVEGTYVEIVVETGTLSITTTPVTGEVFVDGVSWGDAPQSQEVEVGTYTVTFEDKDGYITPSAEEAVVTVDALIEIEGTYAEIPELPAETTGEETLDSNGAPKDSFASGETVYAYSEITNVGNEKQTMLIVVQFKDPNNVVYAPAFLTVYLDPEQSFGYAPGLTILPDYTPGIWTAKINVFDTWPAQGGVPIGLPVIITFTVS